MFSVNRFTFDQNEVFCFGFSCGNCQNYLFNSGDLLFRTRLFDRSFLFTKKLDSVEIFHVNVVRCKRCHIGLGGMIYRDWTIDNHLIRFARPCNKIQFNYLDVIIMAENEFVIINLCN